LIPTIASIARAPRNIKRQVAPGDKAAPINEMLADGRDYNYRYKSIILG